MYWNPDLLLLGIILFQDSQPSVSITFNYAQLIIGLILGLSPTIFTAIKDKVKWTDERTVVQSQAHNVQTEAVENIAQAATILLEQTHKLNDKNAALIGTYETAMTRQTKMLEDERILRNQQEKDFTNEIDLLKAQIAEINQMVIYCSMEIMSIIHDLRDGLEIAPERLERLEKKWEELNKKE